VLDLEGRQDVVLPDEKVGGRDAVGQACPEGRFARSPVTLKCLELVVESRLVRHQSWMLVDAEHQDPLSPATQKMPGDRVSEGAKLHHRPAP
jgi:hypothetical protein